MRTQVGIVGAGPAGLLLSHMLSKRGIESVILEQHDRAYVEARVRAGVLEPGTVELIEDAGVGARVAGEALVHEGFDIALNGDRRRVDLAGLTGGPDGAVAHYQRDRASGKCAREEPDTDA